MNVPKNLKYTKDHDWVRVEGNTAIVGITEFASQELGDIVFVEVETEGENLGKDTSFGSIEAVKTVSELNMPVSGVVSEFNTELEDAPELVNKDPYGKGWIIKIEIKDASGLDSLLDAAAYSELIG